MKRALKVVTNKYFIVTFAFVCWAMFFDQNDWLTLNQRQKELNGVKDNIKYLNAEVTRMEKEKNGLDYDKATNRPNDAQMIEQYARETYRMKHDGEDVYVIEK